MEENDSVHGTLVSPTVGTSYGVVIACEPEQFREFVSGLLGKPQIIEKSFHGPFEVTRQDVENTFHLVDQRIHQQNDASLVQFTVKILYDDDSSILLNSLSDFQHYMEIRPIASIGVVLSWTYLIKFKNGRVPEKQEINLTFRSDGNGMESFIIDDGFLIRRPYRYRFGLNGIFLRISHTERTWGVDIESLLTGHVKTLFKNQTETEKFISKNSDNIGLTTGILFFLSAIAGVFFSSLRFIDLYLAEIRALTTESVAAVSSKLDLLIEIISTGVWPRFIFGVVVFIVISLILSIVLGTWVGSKADNRPASYVLLSRTAEERRTKHMSKRQRDWFMFSLSVIGSIVTGIVSNILFAKFGGIDLYPILRGS